MCRSVRRRVNSTPAVTDWTGILAGVKVTAAGYTDRGLVIELKVPPMELLTTTLTALESASVCYFTFENFFYLSSDALRVTVIQRPIHACRLLVPHNTIFVTDHITGYFNVLPD